MPKKGKEKEVQGKSQGKKAQQEPKHQANNKTQKLQTTNRPKYTAHPNTPSRTKKLQDTAAHRRREELPQRGKS
jgi:hypothetical protein